MMYAIAAVLGAAAVWVAQRVVRRPVPRHAWAERYINLSDTKGGFDRLGIKISSPDGALPPTLVSYQTQEAGSVPTWVQL